MIDDQPSPLERCAPTSCAWLSRYPFHDKTVTVTTCGRICFNRQKINLSVVFAGQSVGIKQVSEELWLVSFMDYDLGYFDRHTCRLEPIENPLRTKSLTHVSGINRNPCVRYGPWRRWRATVDDDGHYSFAVSL